LISCQEGDGRCARIPFRVGKFDRVESCWRSVIRSLLRWLCSEAELEMRGNLPVGSIPYRDGPAIN